MGMEVGIPAVTFVLGIILGFAIRTLTKKAAPITEAAPSPELERMNAGLEASLKLRTEEISNLKSELEKNRRDLTTVGQTLATSEKERDLITQTLTIQKEDLQNRTKEVSTLTATKTSLTEELSQVRSELASMQTKNELLQKNMEKQDKEFQQWHSDLQAKFKNIATDLLKNSTDQIEKVTKTVQQQLESRIQESKTQNDTFTKENEQQIKSFIAPISEKLNNFTTLVNTLHTQETKDRGTLQEQIKNMLTLNQTLSEEANRLTRALKGGNKLQGNWGEFVLQGVLEKSGLRKDEEYTMQAVKLALVDSEGSRQKPDFIINLPDGKHVVIDSKVTLTAFEKYLNEPEENKEARDKYFDDFRDSFKKHQKDLYEKNYQNNSKLNSPSFILMFIPMEHVYLELLKADIEIFNEGWEKNIAVVGPTTLLASLKTIGSLWVVDRQNKNTTKIVEAASNLYDKFVGFVEDMETIRAALERATTFHSKAINKLKSGDGNIVRRIENLRLLGAKPSKEIPPTYLDDAGEVVAINGERKTGTRGNL